MNVTDIDGNLADRNDCKKHLGKFYVKNKHCFLMDDGKWYRIDTNKITYDNRLKKWVFSNYSLINGVVDLEDDGTPIMGRFSVDKSIYTIIIDLKDNMPISVMDENIVTKSPYYIKSLSKDVYVRRNKYLTKDKFDYYFKKQIVDFNAENLKYHASDYIEDYTRYYNDWFKGPLLRFESESRSYIYDYLEDITFGLEAETFDGKIPDRHCKSNGIIPLKDGSLRKAGKPLPIEYASVVLSGRKGIKTVIKQCELLNEYCERSVKESLHIHIGGIKPTKEYSVAIYNLTRMIQDEIYKMFPKAYKNTGVFKGKDYCKELPDLGFTDDLNSNFIKLYGFLAGDEDDIFNDFGKPHPRGEKWNINSRYYIQNLNNLLFSKSETVEWRIHNSTFNPDKIVNWVYILRAISMYALKSQDKLSTNSFPNSIFLKDIIISEYGNSRLLTKYLLAYIAFRKRVSKEAHLKRDDVGHYDIKDDSLINMKYPIKSLVR